MKAWQPDEDFEKADFPRRKRKPGEASEPALPAWRPEVEFDRVDIPVRRPGESGEGGKSDEVSTSTPGPEVRSWQPPSIRDGQSAGARGVPTKGPNRGGATGGGVPTQGGTPELRGGRIVDPGARGVPTGRGGAGGPRGVPTNRGKADPDEGVPTKKESALSERLLREQTLADRESARHVLRHWYWEKPGMARSRAADIAPRDRIYIVLASLGMEANRLLFATMTPVERKQMVEILQNPPRKFRADEIARARTAFMEEIRADHY